ncbi:hypothetical protein Vretimale_2687 [Volvox reticuliferus]|uniref:polynucleotide adenylyltransferase n=1 Tax=Volvox reticuliferus TaxID=1737510 RepID=A0A8J4BY57_9CHLO|nr:hypothetical protein Vretifemale_2001 [Volvox reticuliferus]GIL96968.1 hypothetical protein Vretimale_2687 [Volvox reticuliferus]
MAGQSLEDVYLLRPLNDALPTAEEKRRSRELEEFLRTSGLYEAVDEGILREEVLGLFNELVQTWVKGVCRKKNLSVEDARAHVYTFGSYRLGVHGPGTDMDTLVVGPRYVQRDTDFFGNEKHCLQYVLSQTPDVSDIQPVPDAFVPMIGIKYKGVQMDILYASLAMITLPEQLDLSNHAVLRGCDEATVRSLNGCRVTDTLLRLVPNQDVFRLALRAVKHWASLRGISSNVTGYLGGVNLAIMVAKICQLYPRAEASTVLLKFFILLKAWPWPRAIHLRVPEDHSLGLPVWDPRPGTRDSLALMPVITPAYPAMNSLYNVQRSTLEVMTAEFAAAADICTTFLHYRGGQSIDWSRLFTPVPFFTQHTFYIQVEVSADNDRDLVLWDGWVSSRIRRLVRNLEDHVRVRPFPKPQRPPVAKEVDADSRPRLLYYIGIDKRVAPAVTSQSLLPNGQLQQSAPGAVVAPASKVDLKQPCMLFVTEVTAWAAKRPGMELRVNVLRRANLPSWLLVDPALQQAAQQEQAATVIPASLLQEQRQPADKDVGSAIGASSVQGARRMAADERAVPAESTHGPDRHQLPAAKRMRVERAEQIAAKVDDGAADKFAAPSSRSQSPQAPFDAAAVDAMVPTAASIGLVTPASHEAHASQGLLSQDAKSQLEKQASVADERAALQESQLHNTGRDMGDWLGVDHGVSLATREASGSPPC